MQLIREKVEQAKTILDETDLDCWITFVRESALGGDPTLDFLTSADVTWHSAFIVTRRAGTRAIVGLYDQKTVEETGAWDQVDGYVEGIKRPLLAYLQEVAPRSIGVNFSRGSEICDGLTHGMYLTLKEILAEAELDERLVSAEQQISALRQRKSPLELERIRRAIGVTEEIFELVAGFVSPGRSEREIAAFMKEQVQQRELGLAWDESACPAVFTGPDTAAAHYGPTERRVERGHVLNMDFGVRLEGYCSDLQRTFYVLDGTEEAPPSEVRRGFEIIARAVDDARKAMRPGALGRDVDAVAREIVVTAGFDEFPHALGHQVGRHAHDGTALLGPEWEKYAHKPLQPLEESMVFTIEPRLTVPGRGVVTIEEMVVVTAGGAEYLSTPQRELLLIG